MKVPLRKRQLTPVKGTMESFLTEMEDKVSQCRDSLNEAIGLLEEGASNYNNIYRARKALLLQVAELSLRHESLGQSDVVCDLEGILLDQGITRFEPKAGESAPPDKCEVTQIETDTIEPGLVVSTSRPGYLDRNGEVLLRARVLVSVRSGR